MAKKRFLKLTIAFLLFSLMFPYMLTVASASNVETSSCTTYSQKGVVNATGLNFRTEPTTKSKVIRVLSKGTIVTILEDFGEWLKVNHENTEGYLFKSYVDFMTAHGITTASSLNIRSKPSTNSASLGLLRKGTYVDIYEAVTTNDATNPVWFKVTSSDGKSGYVASQYVNIKTNIDGSYRNVGIITAQLLNMRKEPNLKSDVMTLLRKDQYVIILDKITTNDFYKSWYKVQSGKNVGWIAGQYVQELEWEFSMKASTSSPSSGSNRNHNMALASKTLTGTIILPGEKFSWIQTMGSCSGEKGYKTATVYANKKPVQGYGGGVCQVSTTFNMVMRKLKVPTQANPHSLPVSYASGPDEASVSYPNSDFSFTNTLTTPILVEFVANRGNITCNIYIAK